MIHDEQATTPRALWVLVIAGPAIVAAEQQANFVLVRQACSMQRNVALSGVTIVAVLLAILTVIIAGLILRRVGATWPTEASDVANRIRFISVLGILSSAMSFLVILARGFATYFLIACS